MMISENNKRVLKNSTALFSRMFITVGISLYISREVLSILGVTDFGIYSVVGGVVLMFTFLNTTFTSATSRFLTFELGKPQTSRINEIFSAALTTHIGIAIITFIFLETIGLWFLNNKLVIPVDRMYAAQVVFQLSIISSMISIVKTPYNAAIIANERMNIFAYVSIAEALLKLFIISLLAIGQIDKLILYAILMFIVITIVATIYVVYGYKNFAECKFKLSFKKDLIIPMLSFSSWDLYGNMSVVARSQGISVLLNLYLGPVINAASGIANQVQNVFAGFIDSFLTAVRPQIVKYYASGDKIEMEKLILNTSKYSFLLLFTVSFPLIIENNFVLNFWLNEVPEYAIIFCQLSLINNLVSIMFRPIMFSIHATGKVKRMSLINGTLYLLVLPITYIMLEMGFPPVAPYIANILLLVAGSISNLIILKRYIPEFSISSFFRNVIIICMLVVVSGSIIPLSISHLVKEGFMRFFLVLLTTLLSVSAFSYFIVISKSMRNQLKQYLLNRIQL